MKWVLITPEIYFLARGRRVLCPHHDSQAKRQAGLYARHGSRRSQASWIGLTSIRLEGSFYEVYRVDLFSQVFKVLLAHGLLSRCLPLLRAPWHQRAAPSGVLPSPHAVHPGHDDAGEQRGASHGVSLPGADQLLSLHPGCPPKRLRDGGGNEVFFHRGRHIGRHALGSCLALRCYRHRRTSRSWSGCFRTA